MCWIKVKFKDLDSDKGDLILLNQLLRQLYSIVCQMDIIFLELIVLNIEALEVRLTICADEKTHDSNLHKATPGFFFD